MKTDYLLCICISFLVYSYASSKKVRARDGGQVRFKCDTGKEISVTDAYYGSLPRGRKCDDPSALTTVQGLVNGETTYILQVSDAVFSNTTCDTYNREAFEATYDCASLTATETSSAGETKTLSCSDGKVLLITMAAYADSGKTCSDPNALSTAKALCDSKETCDIPVSDVTFTSSTCASGNDESLEIKFVCNKVTGGLYTHWGGECGTDSKSLMTGSMTGAKYGEVGSGSDWQCFPPSLSPPALSSVTSDASRGKLYGVRLIVSNAGPPFDSSKNDKIITCSICQLYTRTSVLMIPGTATCPTGFTTQYTGYIVTAGSLSTGVTQPYVCLDENVIVGADNVTSSDSGRAYPAQIKCGALDCGTYPDNAEVKCAVCTQ